MRKPKIYIETSVWSHLFAEDAPKERASVEALFAEIDSYEIYISNVMLDEINRTSDPAKRSDLDRAIKKYEPIQLQVEPEAVALADRYVETGVIPPSAAADALHIAIAAVEELNVVVSLNMRHIVRLKTRTGVNGINRLEGYRDIEIATPEEVLGYAGD